MKGQVNILKSYTRSRHNFLTPGLVRGHQVVGHVSHSLAVLPSNQLSDYPFHQLKEVLVKYRGKKIGDFFKIRA